MIETGKILQQRYRIDKQIGQGGMGAVYVATDERFGSTVAIKETLCMDDNYRKAIEREARLLNSLKHAALPRVSDHFLEENGQFLVMEFIPGEDLACILEERGEPFPVEQVLDWADQLLEALDFLHNQENPVIHRDIKPQNLKITPKGQIILLDFGLAKGNVTGASNQTNAKSIFGYSRNYASLEQIQGTGTDPRSDLYSLAATLYHLLTNVPPEDALTRAMSVLSQKPDPLVPANQIRPEIPAGVAAILHKAMDLDAAERPASSAEMRSMMRDHLTHSDLALNTVSVARGSGTDLHSQKTKLMPGATQNEGLRATHAKTEVYPENFSQVTAVRPMAVASSTGESYRLTGNTAPGQRSRKAAMVAAATVFLLLGSAAAGAFVFRDALFGTRPVEIPPVAEPIAAQPETLESQSGDQQQTAVEQKGSSSNAASAGTTVDTAPKKTETAKASKSSDANSSSDINDPDPGLDDENITIKGDKIYMGNVRVENGKVYLPDGRIIPMDRTPRVPNVEPPDPTFPNIDPRSLTPQQRRKLRILRERYPNGFPTPKPAPRTPN